LGEFIKLNKSELPTISQGSKSSGPHQSDDHGFDCSWSQLLGEASSDLIGWVALPVIREFKNGNAFLNVEHSLQWKLLKSLRLSINVTRLGRVGVSSESIGSDSSSTFILTWLVLVGT
jgi:hypothetical protein